MKHNIIYSIALCMLFLISACSSDIIDLNGDIKGKVTDNVNGNLIANCQVSLTPGGKSVVTTTEGTFSFADLQAGNYTLSFKKAGYEDFSKSVGVVVGQTTNVDVTLKQKAPFAVSENTLDFGDLNCTMTLFLYNNSDASASFKITSIPDWLTLTQTSGVVAEQGNLAIVATAHRDKLSYGDHGQTLTISYSGKTSGNVLVSVKLSKVKPSAPTVDIDLAATEVTQNSFKIKGSIKATGGSLVNNYGFCWSTTHNPTIANDKTDNGNTVEVLEYTSVIDNLATGTTYYVRAYATNSLGTSYSKEVTVTTQDVASEKWDGKIATSFAGGSGTKTNPYLIKTGGQLLLMKNYKDKMLHFALCGNIDLNNHNWLPFEFYGNLDGKNYIISNLYVNRQEDSQGLFSSIHYYSSVKNLTIKGVRINAPETNNIGTLAGSTYGSVENVHVIFTETSELLGRSSVGGICGVTYRAKYHNCSVSSLSSNFALRGNNSVGGICGVLSDEGRSTEEVVSNCSVSVNIEGNDRVGGIFGGSSDDYYLLLKDCDYTGSIQGNQYVCGIGYKSKLVSCKVNAQISGKKYVYGLTYEGGCISCYTTGDLTASDAYGYLNNFYGYDCSGLTGYSYGVNLCYSTMTSNSAAFIGAYGQDCATTHSKADGTNTVANCTNITKHLQEAYSEYADYWDFNRTWIWEGKINGKTVKVSCPKLAWEK